MLSRRGKKSRIPNKRELKRTRRAERAKEGKLEASKLEKERKENEKKKKEKEEELKIEKLKLKSKEKEPVQVTELPAALVQARTQTQAQAQAHSQADTQPKAKALDTNATKVIYDKSGGSSHSPTQPVLFSEIAARVPSPSVPSSSALNPNSSREPVPPVFKTPAPEGPYRDEVVVEVLTLNGANYLGTVTPIEARGMIYQGALGLDQSNLASVAIGFNRGRIEI